MRCAACGLVLLSVSGSFCSLTQAQTYEENAARVQFQVWNQSVGGWASSAEALPGQQIEFRTVVSYTGTRTDLFALGEAIYQPVLTDADNTGAPQSTDRFAPWRNGGVSGNAIPNSMLTEAEGQNGSQLASYGRVRYGAIGMVASSSNVITSFRHSGGSNGAPTGSYLRAAGNFVSQWPGPFTGPGTADDVLRILRGVSSFQHAASFDPINHVTGVSNLVIFRGAVILSDEPDLRIMQLTTFQEMLRRVGGVSSSDNRRYISWQTGPNDNGVGAFGHRTGVTIEAAYINFVPAPGAAVVLGAWAGLVGARRRRQA